MDVKPRSTVLRATKRPSAGAHIARGANTAQAGERTVHPIEAEVTAIAVVAPTEIPRKTSRGRQGIIGTLSGRLWYSVSPWACDGVVSLSLHQGLKPGQGSQTFASWNQIANWLQRVEALRGVA